MSEELNNHRPCTAAELSNLLRNERAERAEEINALAVAIGLERVLEAGSILAAVERLAADAQSVPDGWKLVPSRCPLCKYQHGHGIGCDNNPVDIALLAAAAPAPKEGERPDCGTCANRGRVDGLSQETFCEHCSWSEKWRKNHYKPIAMQERKE